MSFCYSSSFFVLYWDNYYVFREIALDCYAVTVLVFGSCPTVSMEIILKALEGVVVIFIGSLVCLIILFLLHNSQAWTN